MNIIDKEPVLRAKKVLKDFDGSLDVIELKTSARTAVLAEVFNSITSREPSKSLSTFFALSTGSLSIMFISI